MSEQIISKSTSKLFITSDNWTHLLHKNGDLLAFISLCASPGKAQEVITEYAITLCNQDFQELFQELYPDLNLALKNLHERYGHWPIVSRGSNTSGGCSDCQAH